MCPPVWFRGMNNEMLSVSRDLSRAALFTRSTTVMANLHLRVCDIGASSNVYIKYELYSRLYLSANGMSRVRERETSSSKRYIENSDQKWHTKGLMFPRHCCCSHTYLGRFWNTRRKIWAIVRARAAARSRTYYRWIWTFSRAAARISSLLGERWIKFDVVISCTNLWQKSQSNVTCLVKVVDAQHFSKIKYGWDIFDIKFKRLVMIYIFISNIPANHFKLTL